MHDLLVFLTKWSPHIWLFGSVFGVFLSGILLRQAYRQVSTMQALGNDTPTVHFWFRHSLWFMLLHSGYLIVGLLAVAKVQAEWAQLLTLFFLVITPLVLVYRSYDSLRLNRKLSRRDG